MTTTISLTNLGLSPDEWAAVVLSFKVALRSVVFSLPLAVWCAWVLARKRFPGKFLLDGIVHLPLVMPPVAVGYLLLLTFGNHGWIGRWLNESIGVSFAFSAAGASLATAVMSFPLMVRAIRLAIDAIDPGLEAAARTLGAGAVDRFVTITLPLMLPGVVSGVIVAFAAALGEFGAVITFVSNIPGVTQTLPLAIYSALQLPDGEQAAARLAGFSIAIALVALLLAELLAQRVRVLTGR